MQSDGPQAGDVVILEHSDGLFEFFEGGRQKSLRWDDIIRKAKRVAATGTRVIWLKREGEAPRVCYRIKPGEAV